MTFRATNYTTSILIIALMTPIALGTTWHVDIATCPATGSGTSANPFCRIQDGINAASYADTVIVAPGRYFENIHLMGKNITLRSTYPADPSVVAATVIDGSQPVDSDAASTVTFAGNEGPTCLLEGLTITGGNGTRLASGPFGLGVGSYYGGGVLGQGAQATLRRCRIEGNLPSAENGFYGGGVSDLDGLIEQCSISTNRLVGGNGGGGAGLAFCDGAIVDCVIHGNVAEADALGRGGGLYECHGQITRSTITNNLAGGDGGGIYNSNATITASHFENNDGERGGGCYGCNGILLSTTFKANSASDGVGGGATSAGAVIKKCLFESNIGGGLFANDCVVSNTTFYLNEQSSYFAGGAFAHNSTFNNCTFEENRGGETGALYGNGLIVAQSAFRRNSGSSAPAFSGSGQFQNCIFEENTGWDGSGAVTVIGPSSFINCILRSNSGYFGGAISTSSDMTIRNCVFIGNQALQSDGSALGGAIVSFTRATIDAVNSVFVSNATDGFGGAFALSQSGHANLHNCILFENSDQTGINSQSQLYLDSASAVVEYSLLSGGWPGEGNIDADPLFVDADGPDDILGTEDDDLRLSSGSPCIDAGDNNAAIAAGLITDMSGVPRFIDDPATQDTGVGTAPIVDMGSYEFLPCGSEAECNGHGTSLGCSCYCDSGFAGAACDQCAPDYYDFPNCVFCEASTTCSGTGTCNSSGGCDCNVGYSWDGLACVDDNECALETDNCNVNAMCANTPGGFFCTCNPGFTGNGVTCVDEFGCSPSPIPISIHVDAGTCPLTGTGSTSEPFCAIQSAIDAATDGNTILVRPGLYVENINLSGKCIVLSSEYAIDPMAVSSTIIDGSTAALPTVTIDSAEPRTAIIEGFTITGGSGKVDDFLPAGGGIYCRNSSPTIRGNVIRDNSTALGGGIYIRGGSPLLERNQFIHNVATHSGGALKIARSSTAEIRNNLIAGNGAYPPVFGGDGGAIDVFDCPIGAAPTIRNNTIVGSYALAGGSAISCSAASPSITNNIVAFNRIRPAVWADAASSPSACFNVFWQNLGGDVGGSIVPCALGDQSADPSFIDSGSWTDPIETPTDFFDDVWAVGDYHLRFPSPCFDAGDPSIVLARGETDMDGENRITGFKMDVGADELRSVQNLTQVLSYNTIQPSIEEAVDSDEIVALPGRYFENIHLRGKNIALRSIDPTASAVVAATILDGSQPTNPDAASTITFEGTEGPNSVLDGLTITGGTGTSFTPGGGGSRGGGILGNGCTATLTRCVVRDNVLPFNSIGLGIYDFDGEISNCLIASNRVPLASTCSHGTGGGLAFCDGLISDSIIEDNFTGRYCGEGGGLYACMGTISRCIIRRNWGESAGGGLWGCHGPITDCIIEDNASENGAGLFDCDGPIIGCSIRNHTALGGPALTDCRGLISGCTIANNLAYFHNGTIMWNASLIEDSLLYLNSGQFLIYGQDSLEIRNCTIVNNTSDSSHGGLGGGGTLSVLNSIVRDNHVHGQMSGGAGLLRPSFNIQWTNIEGGWPGEGNIDADPLFVDADGPDDILGTEDDDFRLQPDSPCVNRGNPATVSTPGDIDIAGNPRLVGCRVDMGAHESDGDQLTGDFDGSERIDLRDAALFQSCYDAPGGNPAWAATCLCTYDFDGGGSIDLDDYASFQGILTGP